ncbi:beta-phosphoglucomutase [Methylomarinovum caldicuralii]|uniref:Beta-phosphoglucomutase n=1 Tax=Methylomarinovum caldicuralii TaxID=438856 RepID=A0AAU9C068_9GAMM|nr:HAD family phosphatase [Methylomarinovum caldicuralii]BCX81707.1 beta-phosphoglucomutase [Methylomarinovum caldicuralii]
MLPPFRAVVLDLDGLLLDTEAGYLRAWRQTAAALGFELDDPLARRLSGQSIDRIANILKEAFGPGFDFERFQRLSAEHWRRQVEAEGIATRPGYGALMAVLRQYAIPYLVATNSRRPYAEKCLELAGIKAEIPELVCRDEVESGKPAPEIYQLACARLGQAPGDCLAVEDSHTGLLAAARAGTRPVWIPGEYRPPEELRLAAHTFESLQQLADAIATIV